MHSTDKEGRHYPQPRQLNINHLTEAATAEARMGVGNKPSDSPENLKELISKSLEHNATLLNVIVKFKNRLSQSILQ